MTLPLRKRRAGSALVLVIALMVAAACGGTGDGNAKASISEDTSRPAATAANSASAGKESTRAAAPTNAPAAAATAGQTSTPGARTISLRVFRGPQDSVLVFVPVTIQGQGPFEFVLDTGASRTSIDNGLADRLQLSAAPGFLAPTVEGVAASAEARILQVEQWQVGDQPLPSWPVAAIDLPSPPPQMGVDEFPGLLGSDILSQFGRVTIDYEQEVLILEGTPRD